MSLSISNRKCLSTLAVADQKQFAAAGEELGLTSGTMSTNIGRLEKDLGFPVFERGTPGSHGNQITLTPGGKDVVRILRRMAKAYRELEEISLQNRGVVRGES